ncbi:MAG: beta-lactamase family protein [Bacteroidia bacterium]|nr:beta-lactamase family protein [Bacteroidia bacterium]
MKAHKILLFVLWLSAPGHLFSQAFNTARAMDSVMHLFSENNCFNGELLVLVDNTKFYQNANVLRYLPEFPYENICVKHLLSHTSGFLQNYEQIEELDAGTKMNNDSILPVLSRYKPPLFARPGTEWIYSNIGYDVLAFIVERVSGMSVPAYMEKYIFKPAGMHRTFIPSGLGWFISMDSTQAQILWHKGRSHGSRSVFLRVPEPRQILAMTDNFDNGAVDLKAISILRILNGQQYRNPVLMSLVQKLGCKISAGNVKTAPVTFEHRKNTVCRPYSNRKENDKLWV